MKLSVYYLLTVLLMLQISNVGAQPHWARVDEMSFVGNDGKRLMATVVTIDERATNLRIVSVPFEVKRYGESPEMSLKAFAEFLAGTHPVYKNKEWIAINGGFSSFRLDVPLGLLIVNGKVYSNLSKEIVKPSYRTISPDSGKFRWSGVLCQHVGNKSWDVIFAVRYQPELCEQALQAGPLLVEPGSKLGITPKEQSRGGPSRRTAICITQDHRMRFIAVLEETYLFPLALWLSKPESEGGLGCHVALNLSGDTSSGIAIRTHRDEFVNFIGEGSFPLPSALILEGR